MHFAIFSYVIVNVTIISTFPAERTGFALWRFEPVLVPAERTGFEPANQFCRLHAFQACLFNHSSTSPSSFAAAKVTIFFEL